MTACNESEFNCRNGLCVGMERRCDGHLDCADKSDEVDCAIIQQDPSYILWMPPPPTRGHNETQVGGSTSQ